MNNLVRLDAESSARLRMVRPGDRTSFIPSAREAGEVSALVGERTGRKCTLVGEREQVEREGEGL